MADLTNDFADPGPEKAGASGAQSGLEKSGHIFDIKKYAIHDGPGIRTTVFFFRVVRFIAGGAIIPRAGSRFRRSASAGACV